MTAKEIYDRKKRLAIENRMRSEESALMDDNRDLEGIILMAAATVALEQIGDALQKIAAK